MGDYQDSKRFGQTTKDGVVTNENDPTNAYPVSSIFTSGILKRIEPILSPELLKSRYLKNIDIEEFSSEEIKDQINLAMNEFELMTGLNLDKVQYKERIPYDRSLYRSFVYVKTKRGPILSVESFAVESSDGKNIYKLPASWLEAGNFATRQINLLPILAILGSSSLLDSTQNNAGLIFLQAVSNYNWLPAFFTIKYTTGVCHEEGSLPIAINAAVGMIAAIELLSDAQTKFIHSSTSISQDGLSQATGGPATSTYQPRIEALQLKLEKQIAKIKSTFSVKHFMSNI